MQYEPAKGQSGDGGSNASLMIKLAKDGEEEEEESACSWNCLPSPHEESF